VAKKKPTKEIDSLTFEQSLAELEQLVAQLEEGKQGLTDSLAAYEQGVARLKGCYQMLEAAERKIELVQSVDANGTARTKRLEDDGDGDLNEKSAARSRRRTSPAAESDPNRVDGSGGLF
jgi:exodeoxyribonuclease VII small subunit